MPAVIVEATLRERMAAIDQRKAATDGGAG
jgi:hypothetical protein